MDTDTTMLREGSFALIALQVRYKQAPILERLQLKPLLDAAIDDFAILQRKLLKEGTITTEDDLVEMAAIKAEIDAAASHQHLVEAGARFLSLVAKLA